ncbi:MAG TPA: NRDE family protein [Burkholderiaceae bacterium]|jgi:uncharacterized protein with NRDE domain|nr:NRDE family protein [Burkholderiaceae bacterium]
MCLVALALDQDRRFPLVIASNRDEFFGRPTQPLSWWWPRAGVASMLSGRDLKSGGTWFGLGAAGRVALVTNVRNPGSNDPDAPSRGAIPPLWVTSTMGADRFWMQAALSGYNGFNVIAGDVARNEWFWASNMQTLPKRLERGVYGLSNAALDTPWPKVALLKARVSAAITTSSRGGEGAELLARRLLDALGDRSIAPDEQLPATGIPLELERALSASFIRTADGRYGTRCSTLLITERVRQQEVTHFFECSYDHEHDDAPTLRHVRLESWPARTGSELTPSPVRTLSLDELEA